MDEDGVGRSVAMGFGWMDPGVAREANDYIIESASKHPNRIIGFCSVNPAWGDVAAREVERCAKLGLRGIGELHPDTQRFDIGDSAYNGPQCWKWPKSTVWSSRPIPLNPWAIATQAKVRRLPRC